MFFNFPFLFLLIILNDSGFFVNIISILLYFRLMLRFFNVILRLQWLLIFLSYSLASLQISIRILSVFLKYVFLSFRIARLNSKNIHFYFRLILLFLIYWNISYIFCMILLTFTQGLINESQWIFWFFWRNSLSCCTFQRIILIWCRWIGESLDYFIFQGINFILLIFFRFDVLWIFNSWFSKVEFIGFVGLKRLFLREFFGLGC